jgi:hypothetical protein|tara:strand:+ start:861 stop:1076 length:216 start_codon:yes stop_codon:yes gene_type:complete
MKSYIQGLITGGVFVFAFMVLTGGQNGNSVGGYALCTAIDDVGNIYETILDTKSGTVRKRALYSRSEYKNW